LVYLLSYSRRELIFNQKFTGILQANETNFLNFETRITQNTNKIDFIAIKFHKENIKHSSETVLMKYDNQTRLWKAIVNLRNLVRLFCLLFRF